MPLGKFSQTARRAGTLARIAAASRNSRAEGENKIAAQRALAGLLADARGIPMKVGQLLSSTTESGIFDELVTGVEPLPINQIQPVVESALGGTLEQHFAFFDPVGIAASLGQVHQATLRAGDAVAVKVRYPDIVDAVNAELRLARLVPGVGPVRTWGFDLDAYKRILYEDMQQELDYESEQQRQASFGSRMNVSGLVIPRVYPELSSASVLVQSWEPGATLDQIRYWPEQDRKHIAIILMCTLFQSLFVHGEIHGDPHAGNYRFRRAPGGTPEVVLLDYGCTIPVSLDARMALLKLILGAMENTNTDPMACFQAMGFDAKKLQPIEKVLPALTNVLLEPFLVRTPFRVQDWELKKQVERLLGELKWWFRSAGPANLLLLLRAFHGLAVQLEALSVGIPWQSVLFRVVDRDLCERARAYPLPIADGASAMTFRALARYLKVQVREGGRTVVSVTFPASQAAILEEIVPDDTRTKIDAAGIDLLAIRQSACASGLVPQELFAFEADGRAYRVWLE